MSIPPILLLSQHGAPGKLFAPAIAAGRLAPIWEWDLTADHLASTPGLVTTMHLDQIGLCALTPALDALLDRGGRVAINAHVARAFITGLSIFVRAGTGRRADFILTPLADHPIFAGIDRRALEVRKGVAGFYGRGHNPPPEGAVALTGVGLGRAPIDWVWHRPRGGAVFSHAGNEPWTAPDEAERAARLADNLVRWAAGETAA